MTKPFSLELAVVGNSNFSALIDRVGRVVWACWPRVDGDPIFCALLDGNDPNGGQFEIDFDEGSTAEQSYDRNTAIVRTVLTASTGASLVITDFVPRFHQFGRVYRPPMLVRRLEPIHGLCRIRVRVNPRMDCGRLRAVPVLGSNHIRYVTDAGAIRLTTDAPASSVASGGAFVLARPMTFIIHADETLPESISRISREFHD